MARLPHILVSKLENLIKHLNHKASEPTGVNFVEMLSVIGAMHLLGQKATVAKIEEQLIECENSVVPVDNVICMRSYIERKYGK